MPSKVIKENQYVRYSLNKKGKETTSYSPEYFLFATRQFFENSGRTSIINNIIKTTGVKSEAGVSYHRSDLINLWKGVEKINCNKLLKKAFHQLINDYPNFKLCNRKSKRADREEFPKEDPNPNNIRSESYVEAKENYTIIYIWPKAGHWDHTVRRSANKMLEFMSRVDRHFIENKCDIYLRSKGKSKKINLKQLEQLAIIERMKS